MSKEKRWTPGTWFACPPDYLGNTVARVDKLWSVKCDEPVGSGEHDARLIAAAPELYDALMQAKTELEDIAMAEIGEPYNNLQINAALAKARGES